MFLAPLIISGFFVLLIIFFPFIIKCIFKFSRCVGYCIGFCCSVLTMLIIVVCSIGIICAIVIPLKDDIESKKINSENILQYVSTLYISIVIGIIIIIFLSVFFIMMFFFVFKFIVLDYPESPGFPGYPEGTESRNHARFFIPHSSFFISHSSFPAASSHSAMPHLSIPTR